MRHLYALLTGLVLVYVPFGNGVSLAILPCALTYLVMWRLRDYAATFAWLIDFTFLIAWCACLPCWNAHCLKQPAVLVGIVMHACMHVNPSCSRAALHNSQLLHSL